VTSQYDGGPAFPAEHLELANGEHGMSLRDAAALAALPGLIRICAGDTLEGRSYAEHVARNAYEVADAMIAARRASETTMGRS